MEQLILLFIQENLWTTGKGGSCAVFTLPEKGVGAGLGVAGLLFSRAAPLQTKQTECVLERIYLIQIYCCYFIK